MDYKTFDTEVLDKLIEAEKQIGLTKGREYTQGDRLDNFKRLASESGITPEQVLWIYLKKHLDSIAYYIRNGKLESESLESRIVDARVYLSLLLGLEKDKEIQALKEDYLPQKKVEHVGEQTLLAKQTLLAEQIQKMIDDERKKAMDNPADVFGNVLGDDTDSSMPLFCVGCGVRFEPDDMVDIIHIVPHVGDAYNAYYHAKEVTVDGFVFARDAKTLATKKASEILDDLNNHRELREREIPEKKAKRNTSHAKSTEKINKIIELIKASEKPMTAAEIYKAQTEYEKQGSLWAILNKKVQKGVLLRVDGMYSYNNGGKNDSI